jgi:hypothetical protein
VATGVAPGLSIAMVRLRRVAMTWGPAAGADLAGVFAMGDVADEMQGFDAPGYREVSQHPSR